MPQSDSAKNWADEAVSEHSAAAKRLDKDPVAPVKYRALERSRLEAQRASPRGKGPYDYKRSSRRSTR